MSRPVRWMQIAVVNSVGASWLVRTPMRRRIMRACGIPVVAWADIRPGQRILGHGVTFAGCFVNAGCTFDPGQSTITVGEGVSLSTGVTLTAASHAIGQPFRRSGPNVNEPVVIGEGSWLGANVVVLPGVTVAPGCVIGAGAVVTASTEPNGLYVGVPARRIRDLPD